jgi:general secretion pathway protein I
MTAQARSASSNSRRGRRGFTLLEVMIALAVLGLGLTVLIKSAAGNIFNSQQAHMIGVVTDLARAKMYDLEEKLLKDGFSDTEQHEEDRPFTDEGWPSIHYSYKIELVELPNYDALQALVQGKGSGAGPGSSGSSGSPDGSGNGSEQDAFNSSLLGGMLSQVGGLAGFGASKAGTGKGSADIGSAVGASFIQGYYTMFQQVLKVSVRKVSLTINWQVMGSDRDMKVVAFFTDAAAMDKVINGMGAQDLDDSKSGNGSGSGSGSRAGRRLVESARQDLTDQYWSVRGRGDRRPLSRALRLDERGELAEGHLPAELVVGGRYAGRQAVVDAGDVGAVAEVAQQEANGHLALHRRVVGLELEGLDDLLVGDEGDEAAVIGVGVRGGLAGAAGLVVAEGDAECAAHAGIEGVHVAGHAVGHHPGGDGVRVEEGAVHAGAGRLDVARDPGRSHPGTVPQGAGPATVRQGSGLGARGSGLRRSRVGAPRRCRGLSRGRCRRGRWCPRRTACR